MSNSSIELLPALDGYMYWSSADVLSTLNHPEILSGNNTYAGRPATKLFVTDQCVVKLRTDFVFREVDVKRKAEKVREVELPLNIYHPSKTWFFTRLDDQLVIGSISKKLTPLHRNLGDLIRSDATQALDYFQQLFYLYLVTAKDHEKRLDEGLSNFAFDENNKLYYVDDDLYAWDQFTSFVSLFAVWIRQLSQAGVDFWEFVAELMVENVIDVFNSSHTLQVLHAQFRSYTPINDVEKEIIEIVKQCLVRQIKLLPFTALKTDSKQAQENLSVPEVPSNKSEHKTETHSVAPVVSLSPQESSSEQINPLVKLSVFTDDRIGVIADVHANAPALEKVLSELTKNNINEILVLGDLVGYGPHPNECLEILSSVNCITIKGNHDHAAATGDFARGFSRMARWAIEWTQGEIDPVYAQWLNGLEPLYFQDDWMAVHGAPIDKNFFYAYVYQMTYQANLDWLKENNLHFAFHGHSHIQANFASWRGSDGKIQLSEQNVSDYSQALFCPGSVGQPRGGEVCSEFAIFNRSTGLVQFFKTDYDYQKTVADMRRMNFPQPLYSRLEQGK